MKNIRKEKGFTIIEVMIVLAIAGLIMAIVFLAVPALQRNTRNTQRRSDATHLAGLVNEYSSNHAGTLPTGFCGGIAGGACAATQVNLGSENFTQFASLATTTVAAGGAGNFGNSITQAALNLNATCNPTTNVISFANNAKQFAIGFQVEQAGGNANSCLSE
jgi:prepilin-type N-terminal cleavage/methylation domain-containing protein